MIKQDLITREWIEEVSRKNRNADKILVEKAIRALLLLEGLAKQQLPFVFKGGTALMLHLGSPHRLSIDIDIILHAAPEELETILDKVAQDQGFTSKKQNPRPTTSAINKAHYKFFYKPLHTSNKDEDYVLLDILFESVSYPRIVQIPIQSVFVPIQSEPVNVKVPCLEGLLGDKLTVFAPNTTGIPYEKHGDSKSMEIIKQLYDIGQLFDLASDLSIIKSAFEAFAGTELHYRQNMRLTRMDVLADIFNTSLCIVSRGLIQKDDFLKLQDGIRRISSFIFAGAFHLDQAIIQASKAAYLAKAIELGHPHLEKFSNPEQMETWHIDNPEFPKLNRLKKTSPEAFFYWYHIHKPSLLRVCKYVYLNARMRPLAIWH